MLKVGGKYKTKNGRTFEITDEVSDIDPIYPYRGWVKNPDGSTDRVAFYMASGRYDMSKPTKYDLIID